jgi:uncharacterized membrane-anchored protein
MVGRWRRGATATDETAGPPPVAGVCRVDVRTKDLVARLAPGDVAVIDHEDLDRVAAESLVACGVVAVVNAAATSSGRYPNEGPLLLLDAGIVLLDECGPAVMEVANGDFGAVEDDRFVVGGTCLATGTRQSVISIEAIHEESRSRLGAEFSRFIDNTMDYVEENLDLLDLEVPDIGIDLTDRHALMVVRGHDFRDDLALIRGSGYISEMKPVLIGVDGGADALLDVGLTPDVIIGDFDSVSERALRSGAVLVVHAYRDGRAPGAARLQELGLEFVEFRASGTSEDIAMLLAYEGGAELIVAVGTHTSMVDFLDKGRRGMASTVVTRMKVGPRLVDAKGVSRLYRNRVRKRDLLMLVAAAIIALVVIAIVSEPVRLIIRAYWVDFTN